jgi:hypothetical protein
VTRRIRNWQTSEPTLAVVLTKKNRLKMIGRPFPFG